MPFGDDYLLHGTTEIEADHFNIINRIRRLEAGLNYSIRNSHPLHLDIFI